MERITLNIVPKGITPVCHASQYDKGREIGLDLMDGLQGFVLSGTETLELRVRKPDNNVVTAAVENTSSAFVVFETTEQMTACEGVNLCELRITDGNDVLIGSLNFNMKVEVDPLKDGIESETEIHNLETQIADINAEIVPPLVAAEVANQYDSGNVIFDNEPTTGHGTGYAVTSDGLKSYVPKVVGDLSDVNINNPQLGEALVFDALGNVINGTVSTVGSIDDLNDVDTTGKANADSLRYNATAQEWEAKPTTVEMTLAEYTALGGDYSGYENTNIIITDAPNLNATAQDISYDGGADTVWDKVESLENKEFYKVRTTQVVIPSKSCTANTSNQLLNGVDIKTLTYDALDNITGLTETLVGAIFLWSNGGVAYATDTLVSGGNLTLCICPNTNVTITKIRLLTFWK